MVELVGTHSTVNFSGFCVTVTVGTFAVETPGVISTGTENCPPPRLLTP